jgi:hypothetical protein
MSILDTIINTLVVYQWWIAAAALVAIVAVIFWPTKKPATASVAPTAETPETDDAWWPKRVWKFMTRPFHRFWAIRDKKTGLIPEGFFLGPVSAHFWFAAVILLISLGITLLMALLVVPLKPDIFLRPLVFWTIVLGPAVMMNLVAWTFTERRTVPNNHVLPLKVLGRIINVLLTNGEYVIPLFPILASNRDNVTGDEVKGSDEKSPEKAKQGLIYNGTVTVHLGKEGEHGEGLMVAAAFDRANVKLRPTLSYRCTSPIQRLGRNRPIKDLNEAARDAVRQAIASTVTGDQANDLQSALAKMVAGRGFYGIRTRKSDAKSGVHGGNLVTDAATGRILCEVTHDTTSNPETVAKLIREVEDRGDEAMKKAARKGDDGPLEPFFAHVATSFKRALAENGYTLEGNPRIGEIELPEQVSTAAARAAAEVPERYAALAQAETSRRAGEVLAEGGNALRGSDAAWAGLAIENPNIKIVHVPNLGQGGGNVIINPS